jgi:pilus assembly protein Flp/PilA
MPAMDGAPSVLSRQELGACRGPAWYFHAHGLLAVPKSSRLKERREPLHNLKQHLVNFLMQEDGPTAVEYAVMLALIIVVCIGAITTLGKNANTTFTSVGTAISSS